MTVPREITTQAIAGNLQVELLHYRSSASSNFSWHSHCQLLKYK